jgi:hypothetical protein
MLDPTLSGPCFDIAGWISGASLSWLTEDVDDDR